MAQTTVYDEIRLMLKANFPLIYLATTEYNRVMQKVRTLSFANLKLDTEASELRAHNTIGLALKEVRLLSCLMSNADRAMTAEELLTEVWPGEDASADSVWMYISFLNAKLQSVQASATIDGDREHPYQIREI